MRGLNDGQKIQYDVKPDRGKEAAGQPPGRLRPASGRKSPTGNDHNVTARKGGHVEPRPAPVSSHEVLVMKSGSCTPFDQGRKAAQPESSGENPHAEGSVEYRNFRARPAVRPSKSPGWRSTPVARPSGFEHPISRLSRAAGCPSYRAAADRCRARLRRAGSSNRSAIALVRFRSNRCRGEALAADAGAPFRKSASFICGASARSSCALRSKSSGASPNGVRSRSSIQRRSASGLAGVATAPAHWP